MYKKLCCLGLLSILLAVSSTVSAWQHSPGATIDSIIEWQDDPNIYFKLSSGITCWIPGDEKNMYSLILSLHSSGKKANIHCHDTSSTYAGITGSRLHRIVTIR